MDAFLIKLQAILDGEKSKGNINKAINRMQHKLDKLKLQATLDPTAAQNLADEIGKLINQKIVVSNIGVDINQANKSGQIAGEEFNKGVSETLNKSSKIEQDAYELAYKELKKLYDLKIEYAKLGSNKDASFYYDRAIADQEKTWKKAWSLTSEPENWNVQKRLELERQELIMQDELEQAYNKVTTAKRLSDQVNEIQGSISNGNYDTQILSYEISLQNLGLTSTEIANKMKNISAIYAELKTSATGDNIISDNVISKAKSLETEMAKLDNIIKQVNLKDSLQADNLQVDQTIIRLNNQLKNNSKYSRDAKKEIRAWIAELEKGNVAEARLKQINAESKHLHSEMAAINKTGHGFFERIGAKISSLSAYLGGATIIWRIISSIKKSISSIIELDTALVEFKKTAKMSATELNNFYFSANDTAKQMGVTTKEIIEQAAAWSKLGFSTTDAATKMAKYSSMFAAISPGMDLNSATDGLISVMKAFKIGLEDTDEVVDGIISKINIIGNTQAVNNSDIVDFLTRSSSAMAKANNTLEDTIALGTAMAEITGDAAGAGQVLKTVSMRVRGYDENTEEFIGNVEELSGKIADLTKTASTPGGISLFSDEAKTEYKSTRQLLQEISEIYDQLTDKNQADLLDALVGKQNGQAVAAILNNFDTVTASLESMANSAGNAEAEMAVIMDSIDYKLNKVKETGTGIAQNLFKREDMKSVIDVLNSFMGILDKATEKLGLFGTIGLGTGLFAGFKNVGSPKMFGLKSVLNIPTVC